MTTVVQGFQQDLKLVAALVQHPSESNIRSWKCPKQGASDL